VGSQQATRLPGGLVQQQQPTKVIGVTITKGGAGGIVNFSELGVNPFLMVERVLWPKSNASDVWKMGTISLIATMNQCVTSVSRKGIWLWIVDLARS
jgi:hypothetical protein